MLKPALEIYLRTMQNKPAVQELSAVPLSNNTVRRRIDDIADDLEVQLVTILRTTKFSLALDESTVRDNEVLLLAYTRFQHNNEFVEEMPFCKSLKTTTTGWTLHYGQGPS